MDYQQAKQQQLEKDQAHSDASRNLGEVIKKLSEEQNLQNRGDGLTPDSVKFSPEYQEAYRAERAAFEKFREINDFIVKNFKKEEKAARNEKAKLRESKYAVGYYKVNARPGKLLIGGGKTVKSVNFSDKQDAENWAAATMEQQNAGEFFILENERLDTE